MKQLVNQVNVLKSSVMYIPANSVGKLRPGGNWWPIKLFNPAAKIEEIILIVSKS